ncbi:MAG: nucleotidyltransferase family protein [Porcipelethomonas sp.]
MKETAYQMLYLTSCALHGHIPDKDKIAKTDLAKLYRMCRFHSLTSIVCMALESAGISDPKWTEDKSKAIRKNILLDSEREKICLFMEENGIWHMPLKGVILKDLYPKAGMRQMADNDILYDKTYHKEVFHFMLSNGYNTKNIDKFHHDSYMKPPVFNFELHNSLVNRSEKHIYQYYADVKERLVKDEGKSYSYHFTDEDFYIYMTVHEYMHYKKAGTGLRSLADTFLYLKDKKSSMNWEYIERQLDILEIADFEKSNRSLSEKIFADPEHLELSFEEKEMLEYCLFSGTYGTTNQLAQRKIENFYKKTGSTSRLKYIRNRIFPPMETYEMYFPFFYRHKILLPVGWAYRLIRGVTSRRKNMNNELKFLYRKNS